jgi:hypothetical protein
MGPNRAAVWRRPAISTSVGPPSRRLAAPSNQRPNRRASWKVATTTAGIFLLGVLLAFGINEVQKRIRRDQASQTLRRPPRRTAERLPGPNVGGTIASDQAVVFVDNFAARPVRCAASYSTGRRTPNCALMTTRASYADRYFVGDAGLDLTDLDAATPSPAARVQTAVGEHGSGFWYSACAHPQPTSKLRHYKSNAPGEELHPQFLTCVHI